MRMRFPRNTSYSRIVVTASGAPNGYSLATGMVPFSERKTSFLPAKSSASTRSRQLFANNNRSTDSTERPRGFQKLYSAKHEKVLNDPELYKSFNAAAEQRQ